MPSSQHSPHLVSSSKSTTDGPSCYRYSSSFGLNQSLSHSEQPANTEHHLQAFTCLRECKRPLCPMTTTSTHRPEAMRRRRSTRQGYEETRRIAPHHRGRFRHGGLPHNVSTHALPENPAPSSGTPGRASNCRADFAFVRPGAMPRLHRRLSGSAIYIMMENRPHLRTKRGYRPRPICNMHPPATRS